MQTHHKAATCVFVIALYKLWRSRESQRWSMIDSDFGRLLWHVIRRPTHLSDHFRKMVIFWESRRRCGTLQKLLQHAMLAHRSSNLLRNVAHANDRCLEPCAKLRVVSWSDIILSRSNWQATRRSRGQQTFFRTQFCHPYCYCFIYLTLLYSRCALLVCHDGVTESDFLIYGT